MWQASFAVPGRELGVQGRARRHVGRELRRRRRARRAQHPASSLAEPSQVKFFYDDETHWVTDNQTSVIATVPGSFQSELGCAADWDPAACGRGCRTPTATASHASRRRRCRPATTRPRWRSTRRGTRTTAPAACRDGANIPFTVGAAGDVVTFSYDQASHVLEISVIPAEPVDDAALVREPVRHPFVDEVLYFAIPDRFNDGDQAQQLRRLRRHVRRRRHAGERAHARLPAERTRATTTVATSRACGASCRTSTVSA